MTDSFDYGRDLAPQHARLLADSAISPEVARARGYRTVSTKTALDRLGFGRKQQSVPTLLIPIHGVVGAVITHQHRPDRPRVVNGKALKYETPARTRMALDVPPPATSKLADPSLPLFITEGARKADAAASKGLCCIAVLGVWNWRGTNERGGKTALPDWESIALDGREVYVVYDSDVTTKPQVRAALVRLKGFLEQRGARVRVVYLPSGEGATKQGLDDFLAAGNGVDDLLALASDRLRGAETPTEPAHPYRSTPGGLVRLKRERVGGDAVEVVSPLTNFPARIVSEIVEDDGSGDTRRSFEIEATLAGRISRFVVPVERYEPMGWVAEQLGARAIVWPGAREHAQVALRVLSDEIAERRLYTHLGWRQFDDGWAYLHGGGSIGSIGSIPGIDVRPPQALARYTLPDPPSGDELVAAVRASLEFLDIAPDTITMPLYAAIWRAVLGGTDFGLHLAGPTGARKTALAAVAAQHFGAGLDARNLPGAWSGTGNALEALLFAGKDALVVIDDFAPRGSAADVQRLHREADRVVRAQGNNSGRLRLQADATPRAAKPPRGTLLSSGEDVPLGQSLRARLLVVEVATSSVENERLSACQRHAGEGLYAMALAGFIRWLAPRYEELRTTLRSEVTALREQLADRAAHGRTPEIVANLMVGFDYFVRFALEAGAISGRGAEDLRGAVRRALKQVAAAQADHQAASEPTRQFLELLGSAVLSGRAHVADERDNPPPSPELWGWQRRTNGGPYGSEAWEPKGRRVGWVTDDGLYLDASAAHAAAQEVGNATGDPISITTKTLSKRLHEQGLLVSADRGRERQTVRKMLGARRVNVLHLRPDALVSPESTQSTQSDQGGEEEDVPPWNRTGGGSIDRVDSARIDGASTHPNRPATVGAFEGGDARGPVVAIPQPSGGAGSDGNGKAFNGASVPRNGAVPR